MGREAGFSAPMLAKARAPPVEMTVLGGWRRKALGSLRSPRKCGDSSPFDYAQGQNDEVKQTTTTTTTTY